MQKTSVYVDKETKKQILAVAEADRRKIADTVRCMLDLWNAVSPVERAEILSRQAQAQQGG